MIIIITQKKDTFEDITSRIIEKNKLNHAYLIEINDDEDVGQVIKFVKKILTSKASDENEKSKIEELIDKRNYEDLKYITAQGPWIKKEQVLEIKAGLSTKSLNNTPRVYVIANAEKLNKSSANTLLKFLEEPEKNIFGILITKNKHQVIDTIVSRCQFMKTKIEENQNKNTKEYNEKVIEFVTIIEKQKEKTIPYFNGIDQEIINNRNELVTFLSNVLLLYNDILYVKMEMKPIYYLEYKEKIKEWENNNNIKSLSRKILALNNIIEKLKYNTNIKLMLDKLIINMSGCEINV